MHGHETTNSIGCFRNCNIMDQLFEQLIIYLYVEILTNSCGRQGNSRGTGVCPSGRGELPCHKSGIAQSRWANHPGRIHRSRYESVCTETLLRCILLILPQEHVQGRDLDLWRGYGHFGTCQG